MTRLDSITLQADYSHINSFDFDNPLVKKANNQELNKQTGEIENYTTFSIKKDDFDYSGINQTSGTVNGKINVNLSAKILADNYFDGININNIEQVIDTYNSKSPLKFNKNEVIDNCQLLSADSTEMLYPDYDIQDCLNAMMLFRTNPSYSAKMFSDKGKGQTVVIQNLRNKSIKRRYSLYHKHPEISRNIKSNVQFLAQCKKPLKILNDAKKALRSELNNSGKQNIRERFGVVQPDLKMVLQSNKKVNYDFVNGATVGNEPIDLFMGMVENYSHDQMIKEFGRRHIADYFNRDIELIKVMLQTKFSSRSAIHNQMKKYENTILEITEKDIQKVKPEFKADNIINHLLELMKAA